MIIYSPPRISVGGKVRPTIRNVSGSPFIWVPQLNLSRAFYLFSIFVCLNNICNVAEKFFQGSRGPEEI